MRWLKREEKVAVLIHGCHLQADLEGRSWQTLIWGSEQGPTMGGRVVMGLYIALFKGARLVTFSTGASMKDGLVEAVYTYQFVQKHLGTLSQFLSMELKENITPRQLERWLDRRVVLDTTSQNTAEETSQNLEVAVSHGCTEILSVTNAFHAPRCLLGLHQARMKYGSSLIISAAPARDEDYGTVVLEPPHRGDRPKTRWHTLSKGFFRIPEEQRHAFEREQEDLFARYDVSS